MSTNSVLCTAIKEFTADLYKVTSGENLIFSPFSLHTVLGMVGMGAGGDTQAEIFKGLRIPLEDGDDTNDKFGLQYKTVLGNYQGSDNPGTFTLLTANKIYVSKEGINVNPVYANGLRDYFLADFEAVDFSTTEKCEEASAKINKWVKSTTNDKIKDLFAPDAFNSLTALVLVNGIYFKGLGQHPFDVANTRKGNFQLGNGRTILVDMMVNKEVEFPHGKLPELDAQAVALPYKGGRLSMVIILPNGVSGGLRKIQGSLGSVLQGGKSLVGGRLAKSLKVCLNLPRFKIEGAITSGDLKEALENLGMKLMFTGSAEFSNMAKEPDNGLYVSKVVHKAFIEVNEEGAEAAAASAVEMDRGLPEMIMFEVNRPFYFQIVDHGNDDLVLFSGHCSNPTVK